MHATHHRVLGMNFILGGYAVPASVREPRVETESQLVVSAPAETDTQPPSPVHDNDPGEDDDDEDEPSTPPEDVIPTPLPIPAPQLQTPPPALRPANLYRRKSKSLQVNIQEPPSEELVQHVVDAFNAPLPFLWVAPHLKRGHPSHRALQLRRTSHKRSSRLSESGEQRRSRTSGPKRNREVSWADCIVRGY